MDNDHLQKVFNDVVENYLKTYSITKPSKYCGNYVPNEVVAIFKANRSFERTTKWIINNLSKENRNKKISEAADYTFVIVLESPHTDEFNANRNNDGFGDHPAIGDTGKNIKKYFIDYINKFVPSIRNNNDSKTNLYCEDLLNGTYRLVLVNLFNFQCSLGGDTNKYNTRKQNIVNLLLDYKENGIAIFKKHFKEEIKKYSPNVILNACTSDFKLDAWRLIDSLKLNAIELESNHPVNWRNDFNCIYNRRAALTKVSEKRTKKNCCTKKLVEKCKKH